MCSSINQNQIFRVLWLLILFLIFASNSLSAQEEGLQEILPTSKKSSLKDLPIKAGVYHSEIKMTDGSNWSFSHKVPIIENDKKYPLVLALHWAGGEKDMRTFVDCLVYPAMKDLEAFIIAPSADGEHWVTSANEKRVMHLVNKLSNIWPIDKDKIIVLGFSNGGIGSWYLSKKYPRTFAASIPMAGEYYICRHPVKQYVIHGREDDLFVFQSVKDGIDQSINLGSDIESLYLDGLGHFQGCQYVDALRQMLMQTQLISNQ